MNQTDKLVKLLNNQMVEQTRTRTFFLKLLASIIALLLVLGTTIVQAQQVPPIIGKTFDDAYPVYDAHGIMGDSQYMSITEDYVWDAHYLAKHLPKVAPNYIKENPFFVQCDSFVCQDRYGSVIGSSPLEYGSEKLRSLYD